jgi:hypothetical protein
MSVFHLLASNRTMPSGDRVRPIGTELRTVWNAASLAKAEAALADLVASYRDSAPKLAEWLVPEGLAVLPVCHLTICYCCGIRNRESTFPRSAPSTSGAASRPVVGQLWRWPALALKALRCDIDSARVSACCGAQEFAALVPAIIFQPILSALADHDRFSGLVSRGRVGHQSSDDRAPEIRFRGFVHIVAPVNCCRPGARYFRRVQRRIRSPRHRQLMALQPSAPAAPGGSSKSVVSPHRSRRALQYRGARSLAGQPRAESPVGCGTQIFIDANGSQTALFCNQFLVWRVISCRMHHRTGNIWTGI